MQGERLEWSEIEEVVGQWPGEAADLAMELREFVLSVSPALAETVAFHALCYCKPDQPYGVIGGNVCMIGQRDGCVRLGFIHGASLPDPAGLLEGTAKAARHIPIRSSKDIRRGAFRKLIRAAIAHQPGA
ncbi:MAG: DUF1801 domain-containing protein [bacterium]|nr:DUF1801 domain-containing protein [bacterium]